MVYNFEMKQISIFIVIDAMLLNNKNMQSGMINDKTQQLLARIDRLNK